MNLQGKKVIVFGLGSSGTATSIFCVRRGAEVWGVDDLGLEAYGRERAAQLQEAGVRLRMGGADRDLLRGAQLVVVSPGIPPSSLLARAEESGVPMVSEVELASWYVEAPIIGITGTNGKSTVTALTGAMLAASGRPTFVGGNFGRPFIEAVGTPAASPEGALVVELSSFQLERTYLLKPKVAVLLNISEDHLDRYPHMAAYVAAKGLLFQAQDEKDHVVVNGDDPLCLSLARAGRAQVHLFGQSQGEVRHSAEGVVVSPDGEATTYPASWLQLTGAHNQANAAAAIAAARLAGATAEGIRKGLREFTGLPHRMQRVDAADDVTFYNDSKATNVGAAVAALAGMAQPVVLIAGGRDKGGQYEPLREAVERQARAVVLLGEAAPRIEEALAGTVPLVQAQDMQDAVRQAAAAAQPGDAVLLAPACSSFDRYRNFVERGEDFCRAVDLLIEPEEGTTPRLPGGEGNPDGQ